jgi:hypothetical protein
MEISIIILFAIVMFLFYKINLLNKHLTVLSFSEKNINKLLVKKGIINLSEVDVVINETIGELDEDIGNKIIKNAKDIGIFIPGYMDEESLKKYLEEQERKRAYNNLSYTDKMLMDDYSL